MGRSEHRSDTLSEGTTVTAFQDDRVESIAAVKSANENKLEPVLIHENALDVLAQLLCGELVQNTFLNLSVKSTLFKGLVTVCS